MCYNVHAFFGEEMERIDRFITNHSMYSRSIVKGYILMIKLLKSPILRLMKI